MESDAPETGGFGRVSEDVVYRGHIIEVTVGTFRGPDGATFTRDVVHHPGAVAVLPVHDDGRIVLVRQYRAPIDRFLLEIPAGLRDIDGEAPVDTARRELIEETGYRAGRLELLAAFTNSAGFCDEEVQIFLATDLQPAERQHHSIEEQHLSVEEPSLEEALGRVVAGEITDAKTVIAVLMATRRIEA